MCEWFALCTRPAAGTVAHPAFPNGVPTCAHCAATQGLTLTNPSHEAQVKAWAESMLYHDPDADVSDEAYEAFFRDLN